NLSLEIRNDTRLLREEFYEDSAWDSLSRISTIDGSKRLAEVLSTRQTGTGTWFINKEEFQTWLHNEKQLLYCPGIPGAGKTVLASMVNSNMIEVDIEDHVGRTPLSWAVAYGHEELSNMLLQKGANPDSMNQFGFTPLFYAAVSGKVGIMQSLIKAGAQVNTVDQNGRTPLFHAAAGNSSHLMSLAFEGDCLASVELLLDYGASATQVDNFGQTPLFAAASNGREFVVKLLIEKNAHLYYTASPDSGSFDLLAYAAMNGHAMTAKLLFEAGAYSVSAHSGEDAPSYVTLANLLKAGSEGRDDAFRDLKDEGADPNIRDSYHRLPLHWAALKGDDNLLKCLLANGADVNAKEAFGRTPLFYAIFGGWHSTTLLLLDYPDDIKEISGNCTIY
ncbi:hypothetical protein Egran_03710, partial [Elaphomyces granulatus]